MPLVIKERPAHSNSASVEKSTSTNPKLANDVKKNTSTIPTKELEGGMKTTMNVVRVSDNHLVFHDGEMPSSSTHKEHVSGGQPHPSGVGTTNLVSPETDGDINDGMDCDKRPSEDEIRASGVNLGKQDNSHTSMEM